MDKFFKVLFFTFGLAVAIFFGSINALLMTPKSVWFSSLSGMNVNGRWHSGCWLVIYILLAVHIGEMLRNVELKKYLWILVILIGGSTLWCGVFFRLHSMAGAVAILSVCAAFAVTLIVVTAKKTRILSLLTAPVLSWYLYLLFINVYLAASN